MNTDINAKWSLEFAKTRRQTFRPQPMCWLSDARGIYIPRDFAASFANRDKDVQFVSDDDWAILEAGPNHEWYWEAWSNVTDNAIVTDSTAQTISKFGAPIEYVVYQDGDCLLVPVGMECNEQGAEWYWPGDETDDDEADDDSE